MIKTVNNCWVYEKLETAEIHNDFKYSSILLKIVDSLSTKYLLNNLHCSGVRSVFDVDLSLRWNSSFGIRWREFPVASASRFRM